MATIKEVKTKIQNANALGIANLTEQGIDVSADATTFDIMTAIAEISGSGGGAVYESIVYNEDNTISLTDKDGVEHTMSCIYKNDKLIGVTYDGKTVNLTYNGDELVKVGKTAVDLRNAPYKTLIDFIVSIYQAEIEKLSVVEPDISITIRKEV